MQEKVFIPNSKGQKLAAVIEKPDGDEPFPGVILLHGFTGYKEEGTYTTLATDLAGVGIASIRFDASGFGESEGTLADDYRFSNYLTDIESIHQYFSHLNKIDEERLGICGQSMGGQMSIIYDAKNPVFKAVCSISAPDMMASVDTLSKYLADWKETGWWSKTSSKYGPIKIPYEFVTDAQQYNTLNYVKQVKVPLLVMLGTTDVDVLPEQTRSIYEQANQPKELVEIEGAGHLYRDNPEHVKQFNAKIVEFFVNNLI